MDKENIKKKFEDVKPSLYKVLKQGAQGYVLGCFLGLLSKTPTNPKTGCYFRSKLAAIHKQGTNLMVSSVIYTGTECILQNVRGKDDVWNGVISGAVTGGVTSFRNGIKPFIIETTKFSIYSGLIEYQKNKLSKDEVNK